MYVKRSYESRRQFARSVYDNARIEFAVFSHGRDFNRKAHIRNRNAFKHQFVFRFLIDVQTAVFYRYAVLYGIISEVAEIIFVGVELYCEFCAVDFVRRAFFQNQRRIVKIYFAFPDIFDSYRYLHITFNAELQFFGGKFIRAVQFFFGDYFARYQIFRERFRATRR